MFVTVKARVVTDTTGVFSEVPALLTPIGVLEPLLDYCLPRIHDRSLSWMSKVNRAVRLFLEYLHSNPEERDTYRLFQNFAQRLYTGTFDRNTGIDSNGLCWAPHSAKDASDIVTYLTDFFDWLGEMRPAAAKVNPRYAGNSYDRMIDEAAYQHRRDRAFLGHTWAANASAVTVAHRFRPKRLPPVVTREPPAFPDDRFMDLLFKGFKIGGRHDYRNMLITLLLHGAGFRESEPFHLYVGDVFPDPSDSRRATVLIHHPSFGTAPSDWRDVNGKRRQGTRTAYLAEQFGMAPRTALLDSRSAGWKGGIHDAPYYKQAYWFLPEYGDMFLQLWYRYLEQLACFDRTHPFAFVNLKRKPVGGMYCIAQFNKAHGAAVERIGLKVAKSLGTTPHGHRHAYGRRLTAAGIDKALIRRFMHHASPESQEVYTQPTSGEVMAALTAGAQRLRATLDGQNSASTLILRDFPLFKEQKP